MAEIDDLVEKAARALAALRGTCACDYPSCIGGECDHDCERNDKWQAVSDDDRERAEAVLAAILPAIEAAAYERAAKELDDASAVYRSVRERLDLSGATAKIVLTCEQTADVCAAKVRSLTEKQR